MGKAELRAKARAIRQGFSAAERRDAALAVAAAFFRGVSLDRVDVAMAYAPVRGEVDPMPIVEALRERGIAVAFPQVADDGAAMTARKVDRMDDFVQGKFGVPEPPKSAEVVRPGDIDLIFVPGLAFDERGHRLGYGGGYYDRFLPRLDPGAVKVGLAYATLVWKEVPAERHDAAVDLIVTERGVVRCK